MTTRFQVRSSLMPLCVLSSINVVSCFEKKLWWWCYPTPSEGWGRGGTPRRLNIRATPQGLDQRSKMEEVVPNMARRRGSRMRDSQGGESDPAEGVRMRCMKNSPFVLSCIGSEDNRML